MSLMICENASHLAVYARGNPYQSTADVISYATSECAFGHVLIARTVEGVWAILIGTADDLEADLADRFRKAKLVTNAAMVHDELAKVTRFVDRPAEGLDLPLDLRGTSFQCRVWEKLGAIPLGRTVTYMELARWVGPLTSARAVASACAANPIALAVPCHRVVRNNGNLADYRWGVERKHELLRKEAMA